MHDRRNGHDRPYRTAAAIACPCRQGRAPWSACPRHARSPRPPAWRGRKRRIAPTSKPRHILRSIKLRSSWLGKTRLTALATAFVLAFSFRLGGSLSATLRTNWCSLLEAKMPAKWKQMTKNQKLDMLRAEVAKLMRRLADLERGKSKNTKPKAKKTSKKEPPAVPEPSVQQAAE